MPKDRVSDFDAAWDAEQWKKEFAKGGKTDYRELRKKVWENTLSIVKAGGYTLPDGIRRSLSRSGEAAGKSVFYREEFHPQVSRADHPAEITVTSEDCLDAAHRWVTEGRTVSVLNMASRRNPGGGVRNGAGAQEEYLFRCSDYYLSLYPYAEYASMYGLEKSEHQYPLDRNYGGIYSPDVTVFRSSEESGYALLEQPWKVNMIAVAGMNSPEVTDVNGELQVAPWLVEGVKNKIRTILRIACDQGQKNLVLGALGCGAFHNPPRHTARLLREVLCEQEFAGAFDRICFAVKSSHSSHGNGNFRAFYEELDHLNPIEKAGREYSLPELGIRRIAVSRDFYFLLKSSGEVVSVSCYRDRKWKYMKEFYGIIDIAAGFDHVLGLQSTGRVISGGECRNDKHARSTFYGIDNAKAVYACEAVSVVLDQRGRVHCAEGFGYERMAGYKETIEKWRNIRQVAPTFEAAYGLTEDGRMIIGRDTGTYKPEFFNTGKKIVQISAFGCYYSVETAAALYRDGTVKAVIDTVRVEEVEEWKEMKKIACGNRIIAGLTAANELRIVNEYGEFKDTAGNPVEYLEGILDFAVNFSRLVTVDVHGGIQVYDAGC